MAAKRYVIVETPEAKKLAIIDLVTGRPAMAFGASLGMLDHDVAAEIIFLLDFVYRVTGSPLGS